MCHAITKNTTIYVKCILSVGAWLHFKVRYFQNDQSLRQAADTFHMTFIQFASISSCEVPVVTHTHKYTLTHTHKEMTQLAFFRASRSTHVDCHAQMVSEECEM